MTTDTHDPDGWGVRRPDGTWVPLRSGECTTSREVAEAWERKDPTLTAEPRPAPARRLGQVVSDEEMTR